MAELDRLVNLAAFDQVCVRLKDRIDLFRSRNLFPFQDTTLSLIKDAVSNRAIVDDLLAQCRNRDGSVTFFFANFSVATAVRREAERTSCVIFSSSR